MTRPLTILSALALGAVIGLTLLVAAGVREAERLVEWRGRWI